MRKNGDDTLQKKQSIESMYNFLLFQNRIMKKTDIMIDVANIEQIQKIIRTAYESAEKFVKKVDSWKAKSVETYAEMKALMSLIENEAEEENKYIIEIVDESTVTVEVDWNFERIMLWVTKNIDVMKSIIQTACNSVNAPYDVAIEMIIEELKSPLKWKAVVKK